MGVKVVVHTVKNALHRVRTDSNKSVKSQTQCSLPCNQLSKAREKTNAIAFELGFSWWTIVATITSMMTMMPAIGNACQNCYPVEAGPGAFLLVLMNVFITPTSN